MAISHAMPQSGRTLHWDQTIDRALVHRDAIAEVMLTDLIKVSETDFQVAAQWPRSHRVYRPDHNGRHDPMLILETVRQAGLALSHFGFAVGFEQRSVMRDVAFELDPRTEPRALLSATNVAIDVRCRDIIMRGPKLRGMTVELVFTANGLAFASGSGTIRWISAPNYAALRARASSRLDWDQLRWTTTPAHPSSSPIRAAADVLIAPAAGRTDRRRLIVPLEHPVYFDHALDHAPGMLLIDAAWQALVDQRADLPRLVGCTMNCPAFTELGIETDIVLTAISADTTRFSLEQQGRETAGGTFRVAA